MRILRTIAAAALITGAAFSSAAQSLCEAVTFTLDHPDGVYEPGQTVHVTAVPEKDYDKPLDVEIWVNGIQKETLALGKLNGRTEIWSDIRTEPTAVKLVFRPQGSEDSEDFMKIGYVVGREGFRPGFTKPSDYRRFWKGQIKEMQRSPMEVKLDPVDSGVEGIECFAIEISMPEGAPVRGFVARPKGAAAKSLPAMLHFRAAGVAGSWCRAYASTAVGFARKGGIAMDINAHGMLNVADEQYFKDLEDGPLNGYSTRAPANHEDYYFRLMFLRARRALDYLCGQKEWDGKRLMVYGESQGGAQSAAMLGLDRRVSHAVLIVPAMIDTGGNLEGRRSGWPQPLERYGNGTPEVAVAPYYDGALFLKGCKADICVEIALVDDACPVGGIMAGLNGTKGHNIIMTYPYRDHWSAHIPDKYLPRWRSEVEAKRNAFVDAFFGKK